MSANLQYIFWHWSDVFENLLFNVLMNLSVTKSFNSLCFEHISTTLSYNHDFIDSLHNLLTLSTHILFGLQLYSFKISCKALEIAIPFLPFKGTTPTYLV